MLDILHKIGAWIHRHERASLMLVLGVAGALLLFNALSRPVEYYGPDGKKYENMGYTAARAPSVLACGNFGHSYWSPGWITTIAAIYRVAGRNPIAIRIFLVLTALVTALICYFVARSVTSRGGRCLPLFCSCFPHSCFVLPRTISTKYRSRY